MEMELKSIIEKIKQEGVTEAEKQAGDIVSAAEEKAKQITQGAKDEKERILKKAREEAIKTRNNAEESIRQASRDVLLGLREQIVALFDKVMKKEIAGELSGDAMKKMIQVLVENFNKEGKPDIEVLLSKEDRDSLEKSLLDALVKEMKKGVTLKASSAVEHGFRIGVKGENSYYDFTDEAIEEAFKANLNKNLIEILTPGAENAE